MGRQPSYAEYSQIMTGYTPEQMPVISALARGFATFDHWHAEVPSQTFTNRSFLHAATASGFVVNAPYANFPVHNDAETLFERLESHGLTWRVYCDPPSPATPSPRSFMAHGLNDRFATNFVTTDRFYEDAENGTLPAYSFIEPNLWHGHNDMHPPIARLLPGLAFDPPSALLGGEALLARIYDAIRDVAGAGPTPCVVAYDEHGGTYDHVPPPAANPPDPAGPAGEMGFTFHRLGVRTPAIAISPWIPERTVVNDAYRHTSVIRTMRERWNLGRPFTARDADAPDLDPVLSLDRPRPPEDWPAVAPQPVPVFDAALVPPNAPLSPLAQALVGVSVELAKHFGQPVPDIKDPGELTGAEGLAIVHEATGHLFPGLRS